VQLHSRAGARCRRRRDAAQLFWFGPRPAFSHFPRVCRR